MSPVISVIVPVYNVEAYLPRCLDSILSQSYTALQVVLVDDGSTDSSGAICDAYAAKDPRITVVHQTNAGIGATRNVALSHCTGELLAFVDSDDFLLPGALQALYDRLIADHSDLAIGNHVKVFEDDSRSDPCCGLPDEALTRTQLFSLLGDCGTVPTAPWGKLYRKSILEGIAYPSVRIGEDTVTFPHILEKCSRISTLSEPIYGYFQRANSLIRQKSEAAKRGDLGALLYMTRYLWDHGYYDGAVSWYSVAVKSALVLKKRRDRLAEFHLAFDRKTRAILRRRLSRSGKLAWWLLHIPFTHRLFQR